MSQPRLAASPALREEGSTTVTAIGGCGFWYGRTMTPWPMSGIIVRAVEIVQCSPSRSYGASPAQIPRMCSRHSWNFALRSQIEVPEHLPVRGQAARADAEHEAPFEDVVEHCHLGRDRRRMTVWQVHRARAQRDLLGHVREAGEEDARIGHRLGDVGDVLADERLREPQPVGEHDRLTILRQRLSHSHARVDGEAS